MVRNGPRAWVIAGALICSVWLLAAAAWAHDDPLTDWAEQANDAIPMPHNLKPIPTTVSDRFVPDIIAGGARAETPCSGTLWVYDYTHGIAAGRHRDDPNGGTLDYRSKPPVKIPDRDLLAVRSQLGLHLGISLDDAARILKEPVTAANVSGDSAVLYVVHTVACGHYACGGSVLLEFVHNRAVLLSIHHGGP
jgi:hypothetical protein